VPRLDSPGARPQPRAREASASSRCAPHRTCALWRPFNFPPGCVAASDSVPARAGQQHGGRTADAPLGAAVSGLVTRCLGTAGDGVSRGLGPVRLWKISEKEAGRSAQAHAANPGATLAGATITAHCNRPAPPNRSAPGLTSAFSKTRTRGLRCHRRVHTQTHISARHLMPQGVPTGPRAAPIRAH
jgi:hypothetical protein